MSKLPDHLTLLLSSWFGLGWLPKAPGTFGSLGALPLWAALSLLPWPWYALATAAFTGLAIAVSSRAERLLGGHDSGSIVIDEVAGVLWTGFLVPFGWTQMAAVFVLFRFFDILKPWPIRWFDRTVPGGAGVVVDDLVAGAFACAILHGARVALGGAWW